MTTNITVAYQGQPLPQPQGFFSYVLAANGVFIHAVRQITATTELEVLLPVMLPQFRGVPDLHGLERLSAFVRLPRKISQVALAYILRKARLALPNEILFTAAPNPDLPLCWQVATPDQAATPGTVRPLDPDDPLLQQAVVEIHSHNSMPAFWSNQDDADEAQGFRIYVVLGQVNQPYPQIKARVGVHGHLVDIPVGWVFDLKGANDGF